MSHDLSWAEDANCRGTDPEAFFPISDRPDLAKVALRICRDCPVKAPCLRWALNNETGGIWGGHTEIQRKHLRRTQGMDAAA